MHVYGEFSQTEGHIESLVVCLSVFVFDSEISSNHQVTHQSDVPLINLSKIKSLNPLPTPFPSTDWLHGLYSLPLEEVITTFLLLLLYFSNLRKRESQRRSSILPCLSICSRRQSLIVDLSSFDPNRFFKRLKSDPCVQGRETFPKYLLVTLLRNQLYPPSQSIT